MAKKKLVKQRIPYGPKQGLLVVKHWSGFMCEYLDICEVPEDILKYATPEEAWKSADREHIAYLLWNAKINLSYEEHETESEAADEYRKTKPIPAKIVRLIVRYLQQKVKVYRVIDANGEEVLFYEV